MLQTTQCIARMQSFFQAAQTSIKLAASICMHALKSRNVQQDIRVLSHEKRPRVAGGKLVPGRQQGFKGSRLTYMYTYIYIYKLTIAHIKNIYNILYS